MSYDKGRLLVEIEGYYYLYSKVQVNAAQECLLIQHKVMHKMNAYGHPIELMKSKRLVSVLFLPSFLCCCAYSYLSPTWLQCHFCAFKFKMAPALASLWWREFALFYLWHVSSRFRCWPPNTPSPKTSDSEDVWNSFLAGIFHLHAGDYIYVTLENVEKTHSGPAYNFMGAFMIST